MYIRQYDVPRDYARMNSFPSLEVKNQSFIEPDCMADYWQKQILQKGINFTSHQKSIKLLLLSRTVWSNSKSREEYRRFWEVGISCITSGFF